MGRSRNTHEDETSAHSLSRKHEGESACRRRRRTSEDKKVKLPRFAMQAPRGRGSIAPTYS
jgi:hypothetical protein